MNQMLRVLESLNKDITDELHILYDSVSQIQGASDIIDNVKLRLATGITEIKSIIENRKIMSQEDLGIEGNNVLVRVNKTVTVSVLGKTVNPRTTISKGAACVVWNKNNKLNVVIKNPLTNKTKNSSEQLALLALLNQVQVLKIKRLIVVTNTSYLNTLCENIELYHSQNYKQGETDTDIPNKHILEQIHTLLKETKVQLNFNTDNFTEEDKLKRQELIKTGKDLIETILKT